MHRNLDMAIVVCKARATSENLVCTKSSFESAEL